MERIRSFFFVVVIYASLYAHYVPASAAPEGKDVIMDEILQVMREYEQHKIDEEKNDEPEKSELMTEQFQAAKTMVVEQCPVLIQYDKMNATCTEVTYVCHDPNHVLIFDDSELCLNHGQASRHCDADGQIHTPKCSAVCTIQDIEHGHWSISYDKENGVLINGNQVLPGSKVSYTCDIGFEMQGSDEDLVCQEDGTFSPSTLPSCKGTTFLNVTGCGGDDWIRVYSFDMSNSSNNCPRNWKKVERDDVVGCHGKITGGCSPLYIELGKMAVNQVCGKVVGHQIAFPDAFSAGSNAQLDNVYVDGLSITYGFPPVHIWTYAVGASKDTLYGGTGGNCPCQQGMPQPYYVGGHMYCDSGHTASNGAARIQADSNELILYPTIYSEQSLWKTTCGDDKLYTCCGEIDPSDKVAGVDPPWFRRNDLTEYFSDEDIKADGARFEVRLCSHEVDMQEGALITEFELYVKE